MPSITILTTPHVYELTAPVADSQRPVLVFVHGWLLSRCYWQPLVQLLQSEYQCLIYDARGFGESQPTPLSRSSAVAELQNSTVTPGELLSPKKYSLRAYAEDLLSAGKPVY